MRDSDNNRMFWFFLIIAEVLCVLVVGANVALRNADLAAAGAGLIAIAVVGLLFNTPGVRAMGRIRDRERGHTREDI